MLDNCLETFFSQNIFKSEIERHYLLSSTIFFRYFIHKKKVSYMDEIF